MGLQLPKRASAARRSAACWSPRCWSSSGCSAETKARSSASPCRIAAHRAGRRTSSTCGVVAGSPRMITGVVVWGLIFYAAIALPPPQRRRDPVQTRYNLPLEIFYTIAPIMMVVVFFFFTVETQNKVLDDDVDDPDHTVRSSASSGRGPSTTSVDEDADDEPVDDEVVYERRHRRRPSRRCGWSRTRASSSTCLARRHPLLLGPGLPVQDGRHPRPRRTTSRSRPTRDGHLRRASAPSSAASTTRGCCSTSRSSSQAEYDAHLEELADAGQHRPTPLLGGEDAEHAGRARVRRRARRRQSDRHLRTPDRRTRRPRRSTAGPAGRRGSSPPPTTS